MTKNTNKITNKVIGEIERGKLQMRPRWHFVLLSVVSATTLIAGSITAVYLTNLFVFKIRIELLDGPAYGLRQNLDYLTSHLPWLVMLVGLLSFIALYWLVKKFDFSYKLGRWTLIILLSLSVFTGTALALTDFNQRLENFGPLKPLYGQGAQSKKHNRQGNDNKDMYGQNQNQAGQRQNNNKQ